jgi:hypothetical protein
MVWFDLPNCLHFAVVNIVGGVPIHAGLIMLSSMHACTDHVLLSYSYVVNNNLTASAAIGAIVVIT